jgi:hypothetical protein
MVTNSKHTASVQSVVQKGSRIRSISPSPSDMWRSLRSTTCDSRSSNSGCISQHCHPGSPELRRKSSEVAIRRHEDKPIQLPRVQQIHGVDNERGVRGFIASGVAELLHELNRVLVKMGLPALEIGRRPTTVRPLHPRYA